MHDFRDINLSLSEKAAQVLVSFRFGNSDYSYFMLKKAWGGIHLSIWDYKGFEESREMIEEMRSQSKIPPFITSDTECGFGQVMLKEATEFTTCMGIAATGDTDAAYEVARATAIEGKYVGLCWTFGPVADVNTNPLNPSTNIRSYGTTPSVVSEFARMAIKGYQENGLIATAKHFPGQGHSSMNSHYKTETINRSLEEMEKYELVTFTECIDSGVEAIMSNHAIYPAFDSNEMATFSRKIITELLKEKMGFKGLVITDCLEMGPIKAAYPVEESVVKAFLAGHDMILTENDFERSHFAIMNALKKDLITEKMLDERIEKILTVKKKYRMFERPSHKKVPPLGSHAKLAGDIARASVKVERKTDGVIPLKAAKEESVLFLMPAPKEKMDVGVHHRDNMILEKLKARHAAIEVLHFPETFDSEHEKLILEKAGESFAVIIETSFILSSGQLGILNEYQISLMKKIQAANRKSIVIAVNPFTVFQYPFMENVIVSYSSNEYVQEAVSEKIFGA